MLRRLRSKSLTYQVVAFISLFILLITVVQISVTYFLMSGVMRANASNTVSLLVNENINRIEGKLSRIQLLARNIRYSVQAGLITGEQFQLMVAAALRENPDISSLCLAYEPSIQNLPRAQVYFVRNTELVVNILNPEEYPYEDWYQIPIMSGEQRWSEPWYDRAGSQTLISSYSIPIISNGRYIGILRLDTQLSKLQQMISTDSRQQIGKMLLLTNNGTFVSSQIDSLVMNYGIFSLAEEYNDEELRKIGQDMIYGRSGVQKLGGKHMFEDYWITYAPLKSNGWSLAVLMSERTIFRDLNLLTLIQGIASAIAFLLLAVILLLRIRHINKPLSALTAAVERVGSGDFDTVIPHSSDFYELQMLTNSFETMRDSLSDYIENLRKTTEEKNRIMTEVLFASTIQRNLIPRNVSTNQFHDCLRIHGILEPAGDIGGDLYDYFAIDDNTFCFAIADVVGKGIVAAMTMTMVSTHIRAKGASFQTPQELAADLNNFLCSNNIESNFVTIILGFIDLKSGRLSYTNAGHVPLFIRKANNQYQKLAETHSTALGVFPNLKIGGSSLQLDPTDEIILVTDGITESMSSSENFFGIERLEETIAKLQNPNPETTAKAILSAARKFSNPDKQYDDITILVIEFSHPKH